MTGYLTKTELCCTGVHTCISGDGGALMDTFFLVSSKGLGLKRRIDFEEVRLELEQDSGIKAISPPNPLSILSLESDFSTLQLT